MPIEKIAMELRKFQVVGIDSMRNKVLLKTEHDMFVKKLSSEVDSLIIDAIKPNDYIEINHLTCESKIYAINDVRVVF